MFGELFNLAVDVVTLPLKVGTIITDGVLGTDTEEVLEEAKDVFKVE